MCGRESLVRPDYCCWVLGWVLRFAGGGRAGAMTQWGVLTASTMHAQHSATRTRTRSPTSTTALPASRTTMHP